MSNTPRFSLDKQDKGTQNWHLGLNLNFDRLDANAAHRYNYAGAESYFYKTAEGDGNYERAKMFFDVPNSEFKILTEFGGSGVARNISIIPATGLIVASSIFPDQASNRVLGDGNSRWFRINVDNIFLGTQQVTLGANDSGGAGFRVLRVPN